MAEPVDNSDNSFDQGGLTNEAQPSGLSAQVLFAI